MYKFNRTVTLHVSHGCVLRTLTLSHKATSNCQSGVKKLLKNADRIHQKQDINRLVCVQTY